MEPPPPKHYDQFLVLAKAFSNRSKLVVCIWIFSAFCILLNATRKQAIYTSLFSGNENQAYSTWSSFLSTGMSLLFGLCLVCRLSHQYRLARKSKQRTLNTNTSEPARCPAMSTSSTLKPVTVDTTDQLPHCAQREENLCKAPHISDEEVFDSQTPNFCSKDANRTKSVAVMTEYVGCLDKASNTTMRPIGVSRSVDAMPSATTKKKIRRAQKVMGEIATKIKLERLSKTKQWRVLVHKYRNKALELVQHTENRDKMVGHLLMSKVVSQRDLEMAVASISDIKERLDWQSRQNERQFNAVRTKSTILKTMNHFLTSAVAAAGGMVTTMDRNASNDVHLADKVLISSHEQ